MTNDEGCKQTIGKPRVSLVPPALIEGVARVRTWSTSEKYPDPESWRSVDSSYYLDAIGRHLVACIRHGIDAVDAESGLLHLEHLATSTGFLLERTNDWKIKNAEPETAKPATDFSKFVSPMHQYFNLRHNDPEAFAALVGGANKNGPKG